VNHIQVNLYDLPDIRTLDFNHHLITVNGGAVDLGREAAARGWSSKEENNSSMGLCKSDSITCLAVSVGMGATGFAAFPALQ
jgi:hypothetical protein